MKEKIHIGKLIKEKMKEEGRKSTWLANKISCDKSNITRIFQRQNIDTELLANISICLETDFFIHYSAYLNEKLERKHNKITNFEQFLL